MLIKLKATAKGKDREVDEIELREPTVGEVIAASKHLSDSIDADSAGKFMADLLIKVSGLPADVIDDMFNSDITKCVKYLETFPLLSPGMPEDGQTYEEDHVIPLPATITIGKLSVTELIISEPKQRHMREADALLKGKSFIAPDLFLRRNLKLLCEVTGVMSDAAKHIPISVFRECEKVLSFFTMESPEDSDAAI